MKKYFYITLFTLFSLNAHSLNHVNCINTSSKDKTKYILNIKLTTSANEIEYKENLNQIIIKNENNDIKINESCQISNGTISQKNNNINIDISQNIKIISTSINNQNNEIKIAFSAINNPMEPEKLTQKQPTSYKSQINTKINDTNKSLKKTTFQESIVLTTNNIKNFAQNVTGKNNQISIFFICEENVYTKEKNEILKKILKNNKDLDIKIKYIKDKDNIKNEIKNEITGLIIILEEDKDLNSTIITTSINRDYKNNVINTIKNKSYNKTTELANNIAKCLALGNIDHNLKFIKDQQSNIFLKQVIEIKTKDISKISEPICKAIGSV